MNLAININIATYADIKFNGLIDINQQFID